MHHFTTRLIYLIQGAIHLNPKPIIILIRRPKTPKELLSSKAKTVLLLTDQLNSLAEQGDGGPSLQFKQSYLKIRQTQLVFGLKHECEK